MGGAILLTPQMEAADRAFHNLGMKPTPENVAAEATRKTAVSFIVKRIQVRALCLMQPRLHHQCPHLVGNPTGCSPPGVFQLSIHKQSGKQSGTIFGWHDLALPRFEPNIVYENRHLKRWEWLFPDILWVTHPLFSSKLSCLVNGINTRVGDQWVTTSPIPAWKNKTDCNTAAPC